MTEEMKQTLQHLVRSAKRDGRVWPMDADIEGVATMPIEEVEDGLRRMGVDPLTALPPNLMEALFENSAVTARVTKESKVKLFPHQQGKKSKEQLFSSGLFWVGAIALVSLLLTITPTLHDSVFAVFKDSFAWAFSLIGSLVIGGLVMVSLMGETDPDEGRGSSDIGLMVGLAVCLGLGLLRIVDAAGVEKFVIGLTFTVIEVSVVLFVSTSVSSKRSYRYGRRRWVDRPRRATPSAREWIRPVAFASIVLCFLSISYVSAFTAEGSGSKTNAVVLLDRSFSIASGWDVKSPAIESLMKSEQSVSWTFMTTGDSATSYEPITLGQYESGGGFYVTGGKYAKAKQQRLMEAEFQTFYGHVSPSKTSPIYISILHSVEQLQSESAWGTHQLLIIFTDGWETVNPGISQAINNDWSDWTYSLPAPIENGNINIVFDGHGRIYSVGEDINTIHRDRPLSRSARAREVWSSLFTHPELVTFSSWPPEPLRSYEEVPGRVNPTTLWPPNHKMREEWDSDVAATCSAQSGDAIAETGPSNTTGMADQLDNLQKSVDSHDCMFCVSTKIKGPLARSQLEDEQDPPLRDST